MKSWIQKKMDDEHQYVIVFMRIMAIILWGMAAVMLFQNAGAILGGLSQLDAPKLVRSFESSIFSQSTLHYDRAQDTGLTLVSTYTNRNTWGLTLGGAYVEIPSSTPTTTTSEYQLWYTDVQGYPVFLFTSGPLEQKGTVAVSRNSFSTKDEVAAELNLPVDSFSLLRVSSRSQSIPLICLMMAVVGAVLFFGCKAPVFRKRTRLARQIEAMGNYGDITREIDRQAESPLFQNSRCTILTDWILFSMMGDEKKKNDTNIHTTLYPTSALLDLTFHADPEDPDECLVRFFFDGQENPLSLYFAGAEAEGLRQAKDALRLPKQRSR